MCPRAGTTGPFGKIKIFIPNGSVTSPPGERSFSRPGSARHVDEPNAFQFLNPDDFVRLGPYPSARPSPTPERFSPRCPATETYGSVTYAFVGARLEVLCRSTLRCRCSLSFRAEWASPSHRGRWRGPWPQRDNLASSRGRRLTPCSPAACRTGTPAALMP